MITEDPVSTGLSSCLMTIQQASSLLTVPVSTLRSWERRYDLPTTSRTSGGHRRYTKVAIDELRLMRDEIARGKRAADAAASARLLLQPAEPARRFIDAFLDAAQAMEPGRVADSLLHQREQLHRPCIRRSSRTSAWPRLAYRLLVVQRRRPYCVRKNRIRRPLYHRASRRESPRRSQYGRGAHSRLVARRQADCIQSR